MPNLGRLILFVLSVSACSNDDGTGTEPQRVKAGIVYGRVIRGSNVTTPTAHVEIRLVLVRTDGPVFEGCRGLLIPSSDWVTAQPSGDFRAKVLTADPEDRVCIIATAVVPTTGASRTVSGAQLTLKPDVPGAVLDSVKVDIPLAQ